MAYRPVFCISNTRPYYKEINVEFQFHSGFSLSQKIKSINNLHNSFLYDHSNANMLEISSKSQQDLGALLSAFNLKVKINNEMISVESLFQASKVFANGGPFTDIIYKSPKDAKNDKRLKENGTLKYFSYFGRIFPNSPKTYFYDWLYINALNLHSDLSEKVLKYDSFSDIEFNPNKSINCQARSVAIYVSLKNNNLLNEALKNKESFLNIVYDNKNNDYDTLTLV